MNRHFAKEIRPLLLPWLVAAIGGLIPPEDDVETMVGAALSFGGFAIMVAMAYSIEFQERTLPLLLSQPIERARLWREKLAVTAIATLTLIFLNWRTHAFFAGFPALHLGPFFGWLLVCATICSAGFWITSVHSILGGVVLAFSVQMVVLIGLWAGAASLVGPTLSSPGNEFVASTGVSGFVYCCAFLWLSREFWKKDTLRKAGWAVLVLALFGMGELISYSSARSVGDTLDACVAAIFVLATLCSTGWWTLVARTALGGAVLVTACQLLSVLAVMLSLSWLLGGDASLDNSRILPIVFLGAPLYSGLFLWAGWRRFTRLELKDAVYNEEATVAAGSSTDSRWAGWLRCRPGENWLNLVRKELRLQKPLAMLAGIFVLCWVALFLLQCMKPHGGYGFVMNVLICLYAPLTMVLAGSMSIGEEKFLGVSTWHLTLPISARRQCLVKLAVGAVAGIVLGLVIPFALDLLSAETIKTGLLVSADGDGRVWVALAAISGGLFMLGFWAATWVPNTIRAALTAVIGWVPLFFCGMVGLWCAKQICGFPQPGWASPGAQGAPGIPELIGGFGFVVVVISVALLQSLAQFRRVRISASMVIVNSLVLAASVALGSFWWTSILISAGH